MIIKKRITKESILSNISQEEIFEYYLQQEIATDKKVYNTIRGEGEPSVSFRWYDDTLIATDFADPEYKGDCFKWAMLYYKNILKENLFGFDLYNRVCEDVDIKLIIQPKDNYYKEKVEKEPSSILIEAKIDSNGYPDYYPIDYSYWGNFIKNENGKLPNSIIREILISFGVLSCNKAWVYSSKSQYFKRTDSSPIYAYLGTEDPKEGQFKLYQPLSAKEDKWRTNHKRVDDYGILESNDIILTKSRKDRIVLRMLGYESYAYPSEAFVPDKLAYTTKYILYDNDYTKSDDCNTGLKLGTFIANKFNLKKLFIPNNFECTDIAEVMDKYGYIVAKDLLNKLINEE